MAEETTAIIIEPQLSVEYSPASITANFDALDARITEIVKEFDGAEAISASDPDVYRWAKQSRAWLNGISREINERRKLVKSEYEAPLKAFEARVKEIDSKVKDAANRLGTVIATQDNIVKAAKMAKLAQHYEDFAPMLVPVVPFDRLAEGEKWPNATVSEPKAIAELEAKVQRIAADWETIKGMHLPQQGEAERVLFSTLDLGRALDAAARRQQEVERIEALKAQQEENRRAEEEAARLREAAESLRNAAISAVPDGLKGLAREAVREAVEAEHVEHVERLTQAQPIQQAQPEPQPAAEERSAWTITIKSATKSQILDLANYLQANGLSGSVRRIDG